MAVRFPSSTDRGYWQYRSEARPYNRTPRLAEPCPMLIADTLARVAKPSWYPGIDEAWQWQVKQLATRETWRWQTVERHLGRYYGIKIDREPKADDCWHQLALALATIHVPAFQCGRLEEGRHARTARKVGRRRISLSPSETEIFAWLIYDGLKKGLLTPHKLARNAVQSHMAPTVWKPKRARKGLDSEALRALQRTIPFETARYYVPLVRSAWRDVCAGNATTFQYQVVQVALVSPSGLNLDAKVWRTIFALDDGPFLYDEGGRQMDHSGKPMRTDPKSGYQAEADGWRQ